MATEPHRDDQPKTPTPSGTGRPPHTPKPAIPNMSIEDPVEAEEVLDADVIPVDESASDAMPVEAEAVEEEPFVVSADEEVIEVEPVSEHDIAEAEPVADEVFDGEAGVEVVGSSAVLAEAAAEDVQSIEAAPGHAGDTPPEPAPSGPASDVDLAKMFEESATAEPSTPPPGAPEQAETGSDVTQVMAADDVANALAQAAAPKAPRRDADAALEAAAAAEIEAAPPAAEADLDDAIFEEAVAEPASAVRPAEEIAAPASDIHEAAEEVAEAMPESGLIAEEPIEEAAEAMPDSAVLAAEEAEEVAEAEPVSGLTGESVLADEAIVEVAPVSDVASAEVAEEVAEVVPEPSSATRKTEAVLDDEIAEAVESSSGAVIFDDDTEFAEPVGSGAHKGVDLTVAFEMPSSAAKQKNDDDLLVTEEELDGAAEASAVDLGEMPAAKGSSVTGIDKVAEALESGLDLGAEEAEEVEPEEVVEAAEEVPSGVSSAIEFDEVLDDDEPKAKKKATSREDDIVTEMDTDGIAEAAEAEAVEAVEADEEIQVGAKKGKKAKAAAKATGDDIDLDAIFDEKSDEAEAVEAVEPVEAGEAIAVSDDEDAKPKKKGKKKTDDAEAEAATADAEEEVSAKKKKKKKDRELATVGGGGGGGFLRILIGMFVMGFLFVGGGAAVWFFAPGMIKDFAEINLPKTPTPPPGKQHVETPLEQAHKALDQQKYAEVATLLQNPVDPAEFSVRGEAKWLAYYEAQKKKNAPLDLNAPDVKAAKDDLKKGNNVLLIQQIDTQLAAVASEKDLAAQLAKLTAEKGTVEKQLNSAVADKQKAEKLVDGVANVLVAGKHLNDKADFNLASVQKIMKGLSDDRASLAAVDKLLKGANIKASGEAGLTEVLKLKTGLENDVAAVDKVLANEKTKAKGAQGVLEIVAARDQMAKQRDLLAKNIADAFKEFVDGKILPPDADPNKQLVEGAKLARLKSESPLATPLAQLGMSLGGIGTGTGKAVQGIFDLAAVGAELLRLKAQEKFIESPQQKMDTYITLLQDRSQKDAKRLGEITREADWVLSKESKSDDQARGKARYVQGLAHRNREEFQQARTAFEDTQKIASALPAPGVWSAFARKSLAELTDPQAYYLPRIDKLRDENLAEALNEANIAIRAMPNEQALFARRALVRIEMIKGTGPKIADAAQQAIRADAAAAKKSAKYTSESAYIVGLLEEEMRNWPEAEKSYREAIAVQEKRDAPPDDAGRYRIALTRILLRDRNPEAAPAPEEKKKDDKGVSLPQAQGSPEASNASLRDDAPTLIIHPWSLLVASAVVNQQPEQLEDPETLARLKEVIDEANKLIASKNPKLKGEGYLALGKALSKLGKRSEGLKAYSDGLKLIYPGINTGELKELIDTHPAFQQPDASDVPNPIMAERHFGEGMHHYWAKQYPAAEAQFRQAIKYYDKDARYQYFLGLAQIAQRTRAKRDAAFYAFEQGARLEARSAATNPLVVRDVNTSLERIQGELRQYINGFRYKAANTPDEPAK